MTEPLPVDLDPRPGVALLSLAQEIRIVEDGERAAREILDETAAEYAAFAGVIAPEHLTRRLGLAASRVVELADRRRLLVEEMARIRSTCPTD